MQERSIAHRACVWAHILIILIAAIKSSEEKMGDDVRMNYHTFSVVNPYKRIITMKTPHLQWVRGYLIHPCVRPSIHPSIHQS